MNNRFGNQRRRPRTWMHLAFLLAGGLLLTACNEERSAGTPGLFSLKLKTVHNSLFDLSTLKKNTVSIFVFLAPGCPLSESYTLPLNEMRKEFQTHSVGIYGVIAGTWFSETEIQQFADTYKLSFPVLLDPEFHLADVFAATVTPEAFAADSQGVVLYKGAIDNRSPSLGQHRRLVTEHYVREAIENHLQGQPVRQRETPAIGCFIERTDKHWQTPEAE